MRLGIDKLLRQLNEGDPPGGHHQAEVYTLEQKDGSVLQAAGDRVLADESPVPGQPVLAGVLQRGTGAQVAL